MLDKISLTTSQMNIWNIQKLHPDRGISNLSALIVLDYEYSFEKMNYILNELVKRNDGLRTRFIEEDGQVFQYINEYSFGEFDALDYSHLTYDEIHAELERESTLIMNMIDSNMYVIKIIKLPKGKIGIYSTINHLICDAWAFPLMVDLVVDAYHAQFKDLQFTWEERPQFSEYLRGYSEYFESKRYDNDKKYFEEKYDKEILPSPITSVETGKADVAGLRMFFTLDEKINNDIKGFCDKYNISLAIIFEAILMIYLNKINSQKSVTISIPTLNRKGKEKKIIGMFIGMLPLTVDITENMNMTELFNAIQSSHSDIFRHQKYPIGNILESIRQKHDFEGRLFDVMFNYQNGKSKFNANIDVTTKFYSNGCSEVPLVMLVDERDNKNVIVSYDYQTSVFSKEDIDQIHERFIFLLQQIISSQDISIDKLSIVPPSEVKKLESFNATETDIDSDHLIHHIFEEQVLKKPNNIAVKGGDRELTYYELNEKANKFANFLISKGITNKSKVCVAMKKSCEFMIAFWGIIKASATYVPIDPDYPTERIKYMINDSDADLLITSAEFTNTNNFLKDQTKLNIVCLDETLEKEIYSLSGSNLNIHIEPMQSAYMIYTSGSTGEPKGVENTHIGLKNRIVWMQKEMMLNDSDKVLHKTSVSFDVSVWELTWPFVVGACQVLADSGSNKDNKYIKQLIDQTGVTTLHFVPSILDQFLLEEKCSSLKRIVCSGEELKYETAKKCKEMCFGADLYNLYGPTEAAIDVTYFKCENLEKEKSIPIGKPISNIKIDIVDKNFARVPIGIIGELIISGIGVAKGYYNKESLTNQKFGRGIFENQDLRYYKTGDMARWRNDGNIEFLGRLDNQVKINGVRIETGEIEHCIMEIPGIEKCVVTVGKTEKQKYLIAFIVSEGEVNSKEIRKELLTKLPKKWIPSVYQKIESIPLSENGKINYKILNTYKIDEKNLEVPYVEPRTEKESLIANIIKEVFQLKKIGIDDDLFTIGLDSIKCIRIITEISKVGGALLVEDMYNLPTIRELAEFINFSKNIVIKKKTTTFQLLSDEDRKLIDNL
ncbi:MAG: amino acid adenylation domain-containing protein [Ruminiclostridium sp.]